MPSRLHPRPARIVAFMPSRTSVTPDDSRYERCPSAFREPSEFTARDRRDEVVEAFDLTRRQLRKRVKRKRRYSP